MVPNVISKMIIIFRFVSIFYDQKKKRTVNQNLMATTRSMKNWWVRSGGKHAWEKTQYIMLTQENNKEENKENNESPSDAIDNTHEHDGEEDSKDAKLVHDTEVIDSEVWNIYTYSQPRESRLQHRKTQTNIMNLLRFS